MDPGFSPDLFKYEAAKNLDLDLDLARTHWILKRVQDFNPLSTPTPAIFAPSSEMRLRAGISENKSIESIHAWSGYSCGL